MRFFDVGVNLEGFWNNDRMALQVEDIYDVLAVKFPHYDFLLMLDQSSGHGQMREGALNVNSMSVRWGGKQDKIRSTKIKEVGPYHSKLRIGKEEKVIFIEADDGPFYLSDNHCWNQRYDRDIDKRQIMTKMKKEIKKELKEKGHVIRGHCGKEELDDLAKRNGIALTYKNTMVEEGWLGKPKGLLQVLWERGWIDETKINDYSLRGKASQMDEEGNILPQHRRFVLRSLMADCTDFREEKSAMEVLLQDLSTKSHNNQKIELLVSPKYHCKLAGEGIEYVWAVMKK